MILQHNISAQNKKAALRQPILLLCFERLELFLNLGALAHTVTEIVKLRTANLTASDDLNLFNVGRMYREGLLNAAAVRNTSYSEGLGDTAAILSDDGTLEHLNSLSVALFDLVVDLNGVTNVKYRGIFLELLTS